MGKTNTAIIIGSGVAGMATAIRLAVQGLEVHVYEKNSFPGGKLTAFKKEGYHFDAGPSLFTQPHLIEELFDLAEEPIADYFSYQPVPVACSYFFENGKKITCYADTGTFAGEMEKLGEDPAAVKRYLQSSKTNYEKIGGVFLNHSLHKRKTWLHKRVLHALSALKPAYLLNTLNGYNTNKFKSPEAAQLFNRYATYNGSNPYKAPAMLSLIPHLEINKGTFYPQGGMISITNALYKLAEKKGVTFHFNSGVDRIINNEGRAVGIVTNTENILADVVVSNADIHFTFSKLLADPYKVKRLQRKERSSSALVFYWGINRSFKSLGLHNILFSNNYKAEFDHLFIKKQLFSDPTIYINITSKLDKTHAPSEKENWFVMINAPSGIRLNPDEIKDAIRKTVIEKINRLLQTDIEPLIETEEILTPQLIEQNTNAHAGSLYGSSSNSRLAAFFRQPNFSGTIKNLYFCGGTVHPGGGIPLCLHSAKITSELIMADSKKYSRH